MSDSDDQDKTRIQPRQRPVPPRRPSHAGKGVEGKVSASPPTVKKPQRPADGHGDSTVFSAANKAKTSAVRQSAKARVQKQLKGVEPPLEKTQVMVESKAIEAHDVLKGRFILERVLGAGGMGVVYRAKDLLKVEAKDRDPYVAIKVLGEEFKSHPEAFIALQRESRKTQRIAHPNIVNVHDFDKDGDTVFMTMEYLEGTPLDKLVKKYRSTGLPLNDVWQILDGVCAALAYAHDQNIIHSDLKPGNIFVTNHTLAKVFDFGIARAVAKAEQGESEGDKTVFDAGNLGALTPAYASLEMLEGDTPDVRDDIYALGCIAYELFTGEHPYKRKNAKEAKRAGMKPARIEDISKEQWRVIESALAFDRENRIATVKEFWTALTKKHSRPYMLWTTMLLVVVITGALVYDQLYRQTQNNQPQLSEADFRVELENKIRLELIQETLAKLLDKPAFDARWETAVWQQMQNYVQLIGDTDERVIAVRSRLYQLYLEQISKDMAAKEFKLALSHIANGRRYTSDQGEFDRLESSIQSAVAAELKLQELEFQQRQKEKEQQAQHQQKAAEEARKRKEYELALANIKEQLKCNALLDMGDFGIAVKKLRSVNSAYYRKEESEIVSGLAQCIKTLGRNFPDRAQRALKDAQQLFPGNSVLRNIRLVKKDACSISLAGLGARGRRTLCQDDLSSGSKGPDLVVIPGRGNTKPFAIGKYEVSIDEYNQYCISSRACDLVAAPIPSLPITGISAVSVRGYLDWLSTQSGKSYRLPNIEEWTIAAMAKNQGLDSNRNCYLDSRGLQKGGALISTTIGQQNGWGLVNHVGNAREWATNGGKLYVVGGSYKTDMDQCDLKWKRESNGLADDETGFRVLRELDK